MLSDVEPCPDLTDSDTELCPDMTDTSSVGQEHHKHGLSWLFNIQGCNIQIFKDNLPADAPVALCVGECGEAVYTAGVQTFQLTFTTDSTNVTSLLDSTSNVFQDVFRIAMENNSKGVYLVGFGFGAFVVSKLLSDRQFFMENPVADLFQAAYLISGLYDVTNEEIENITTPSSPVECTSPTTCGSVPKTTTKPSSLIDNLIMDKQSFDDRKNLSFICDFSDKSPVCGEFYTNELKKLKQIHGIHATQKETFVNSPVYQSMLVDNKVTSENAQHDVERVLKLDSNLNSIDDMELFKRLSKEIQDTSPMRDDYTHLCPMGIRLYVFAGENDADAIKKQSRIMYDRVSNGCHTGNMHFQIKEKLDMASMKGLFQNDDNFLKRLIRYDIVKNL